MLPLTTGAMVRQPQLTEKPSKKKVSARYTHIQKEELTRPKRIHHDRGQHAEGRPVREPTQPGHDPEVVWVLDAGGEELVDGEEDGGDDDAPEAGGAQLLDDVVGADARGEAAGEGAQGEDGDVQELAVGDEGFAGRGGEVRPEGLDVVADVAWWC